MYFAIMLLECVHQRDEESGVVICITRDLKAGTWDRLRSVKFSARYASSLFFCVEEEKQRPVFVSTCIFAPPALCLFMMQI